jgi:hypothetical protein
MRDAYKRIMPEQLVQTRVPKDIGKKIAEAARLEGDTVAGWIRRLLFRQFGVAFVEAWTRPVGSAAPDEGVTSRAQPQYLLRPLRDISASDRVFVLHDHTRAPVTPDTLRESAAAASRARWFILRGSPVPWEIAAQYAVGSSVEVTLRPVR